METKKALKASEGAHFFFTLIFLISSGIIQKDYQHQQCPSVNIELLIDTIFYGLIVWGTYLIVSLLPKYNN
jgi:succinate dehydrogenase hydrophobic anchor subunit